MRMFRKDLEKFGLDQMQALDPHQDELPVVRIARTGEAVDQFPDPVDAEENKGFKSRLIKESMKINLGFNGIFN